MFCVMQIRVIFALPPLFGAPPLVLRAAAPVAYPSIRKTSFKNVAVSVTFTSVQNMSQRLFMLQNVTSKQRTILKDFE